MSLELVSRYHTTCVLEDSNALYRCSDPSSQPLSRPHPIMCEGLQNCMYRNKTAWSRGGKSSESRANSTGFICPSVLKVHYGHQRSGGWTQLFVHPTPIEARLERNQSHFWPASQSSLRPNQRPLGYQNETSNITSQECKILERDFDRFIPPLRSFEGNICPFFHVCLVGWLETDWTGLARLSTPGKVVFHSVLPFHLGWIHRRANWSVSSDGFYCWLPDIKLTNKKLDSQMYK